MQSKATHSNQDHFKRNKHGLLFETTNDLKQMAWKLRTNRWPRYPRQGFQMFISNNFSAINFHVLQCVLRVSNAHRRYGDGSQGSRCHWNQSSSK